MTVARAGCWGRTFQGPARAAVFHCHADAKTFLAEAASRITSGPAVRPVGVVPSAAKRLGCDRVGTSHNGLPPPGPEVLRALETALSSLIRPEKASRLKTTSPVVRES